MLKETITYIDYNGTERTEDFYFNLDEAEIMELEMSIDGGLVEMIQRIVSEQKASEIIKIFKKLVLMSYGIKSLDGKRFEKSEEISTAFSQTKAYSKLFMRLGTDADYAVNFFKAIIPEPAQENK